ncbi:MAG: DNA topoisomerase, partial [Candidatus Heimdallarchaeota archaeon]
LEKGNPKNASKGRFTKDHEPISPVKSATEKDITSTIKGNDFEASLAWRIYEYIVRRFFSTIYLDGEIQKTQTLIEVNGEEFIHNGQKIIKKGFLELFPYRRIQEIKSPILKPKVEFLVEISEEKKFTLPPELWSESRIIREMARLNIGTDATRSQHIATVIDRGYISVQSGSRTLIPTEIGLSFHKIFTSYAENLIIPEIRETVEKWTLGIRTGEMTPEKVDTNVIQLTKSSLKKLKDHSDEIFPIFTSSIKKITKEGDEFGICMICNEKLILKSSVKGKRFLLCTNEQCKKAYPLPKKGAMVLLPEKCHACPMYPIQVGTGTKSWIFCPNCWIERQNSEGLLFCSKCVIETCPYSSINNSFSTKQERGKLGTCPKCKKGQIILFFDEWRTKLECNNDSCDNEYKAPNIRAGTSIQIDLNCKLCNLSTLLVKRKGKAAYNMCPVCSLMCFQCIHRCFG